MTADASRQLTNISRGQKTWQGRIRTGVSWQTSGSPPQFSRHKTSSGLLTAMEAHFKFFDMIADLLSMGRIDSQVALKFEHKTSKGCTSSGNPYEWGIYQ